MVTESHIEAGKDRPQFDEAQLVSDIEEPEILNIDIRTRKEQDPSLYALFGDFPKDQKLQKGTDGKIIKYEYVPGEKSNIRVLFAPNHWQTSKDKNHMLAVKVGIEDISQHLFVCPNCKANLLQSNAVVAWEGLPGKMTGSLESAGPTNEVNLIVEGVENEAETLLQCRNCGKSLDHLELVDIFLDPGFEEDIETQE